MDQSGWAGYISCYPNKLTPIGFFLLIGFSLVPLGCVLAIFRKGAELLCL